MYRFNLEGLEIDKDLEGFKKEYSFTDNVELLLVELISNGNNGNLIISDKDLFLYLGMANVNYFNFIDDKLNLSKLLKVGLLEVEDFYSISSYIMYNTLNKINEKLFNNKIITHYNYNNGIHSYSIIKNNESNTNIEELKNKINAEFDSTCKAAALHLHTMAKRDL